MKVFISWSGDLSKILAEILKLWLPKVIQAIKPYYSPDDITKGVRWNIDISKELDESSVGIICLTPENLDAPWIMFEAGALSKGMGKSKVCPILFGVEPTDVKGPLVQFEAARFEKSEIKKLIKMLNSELDKDSLADDVLEAVFNMWWPELLKKVNDEIEKAKDTSTSPLRSERDLLMEILELTRSLSRTLPVKKIPLGDANASIFSQIIRAIESRNFSLKYLPDEGPFSVLFDAAGNVIIVDYDDLESSLKSIDNVSFSSKEKDIVEKIKLGLYKIYLEIRHAIGNYPSPNYPSPG